MTHIITRTLIPAFFIVRTEFHIGRMQTKFRRSCPHRIPSWAGLMSSAVLKFHLKLNVLFLVGKTVAS